MYYMVYTIIIVLKLTLSTLNKYKPRRNINHAFSDNIKTGIGSLNYVTRHLKISHTALATGLRDLGQKVQKFTNFTVENYFAHTVYDMFLSSHSIMAHYSYDTNLLSEIVHLALLGQIHSSVLSPHELLVQFKEIKINLPKGTDLPVGLNVVEAHELMKLSDITIYSKNDSIVFIIDVPIVEQNELILYLPQYIIRVTSMFALNQRMIIQL